MKYSNKSKLKTCARGCDEACVPYVENTGKGVHQDFKETIQQVRTALSMRMTHTRTPLTQTH